MSRRSFSELVSLIADLRGEDGCPWDREQTHVSLRSYLIEEAYETIAAIDAHDPEGLCDELGDLLLQVLLHSQIASEAGEFTIEDVIGNLAEKLIRRHPHVFGDAPSDIPSIKKAWEKIKSNEVGRRPHPLPPLLAARKLIEREMNPAEIDYPSEELAAGGRIIEVVKATWESGFDPEVALRKAIVYLSDKG